jgi:hypothetical protein
VPEDDALRQGARRPGALLETRVEAIEAIAQGLVDASGGREKRVGVTAGP